LLEMERIEEERRKCEEAKDEEERREVRKAFRDLLPPEPDVSKTTTRICLKTPNGDSLTRNFLLSDTIKTLVQFAASEGFGSNEFKLLEGFPRRDLTSETDSDQSLEQARLFPRVMIFVEQRSDVPARPGQRTEEQ